MNNIRGVQRFFMAAALGLCLGTVQADDDKRKKLAVDKVEGNFSVMVLGSGGPIATAEGRASAGYLVFIDGKPTMIMDAGGGSFQRLAASGAVVKDLDMVLLTHLHIDHMGDLSPMIKTIYFHNVRAGTTREAPIHIWGPQANGVPFPNTEISQYPASTEYVHSHYAMPNGSERYINIFARAIRAGTFSYEAHDLRSKWQGATVEDVFARDGYSVKSIAVKHGPVPAVAFRIEYDGKSVVYSGDTNSESDNMITLSRDADLLIYDTAITEVTANPVFMQLHTTPSRIGQVAAAANVKTLVLSHITPMTENITKEIKAAIRAQGFTGKIKVAKDLKVYNLDDD